MKTLLASLIVAMLVGCAGPRVQNASPVTAVNGTVKPTFLAAGVKITHVDAKHRFVVLDFAGRVMPGAPATLNVFRAGKLVGQVQISGPSSATRATADILEGDLKVGDEAR